MRPADLRGLVDMDRLQEVHVAGPGQDHRLMQFRVTETATIDSALGAVLSTIAAHTESRQVPAAGTVYRGLATNWPCAR